MVLIAPSILAGDFTKLGEEIKKIEKAGADLVHIDIMDGNFVPNLTFGPQVVKQLRQLTALPFDTHLMVNNADEMIPWFKEAGSDIITVHYEAVEDLKNTLKTIRNLGLKAGVSIKPATAPEVLEPYLEDLDVILVMTVEPGFSGQKFMEDQLTKITALKEMVINQNIQIEVDGGINEVTAKQAIEAGADILVAGNYVFKGSDYAENIKALR